MKHKTHFVAPALSHALIYALAITFFASGGLLLWAATLKLPDFNSFVERRVSQSTKIYDRTGKVLLYDVHGNIRRTVVPFANISNSVKQATMAIEDDKFYEHKGVRPSAILRALLVNIMNGANVQGGSTITQQVVKNALLTTDKQFSRKIKEAILALKLEHSYTKDEIFAMYLNESSYGGNIYGVEEASMSFFRKHAADVSLTEAAYLAALPKAPSYYSPYGPNRDRLETRKNLVLKRMKELGWITEAQLIESTKDNVTFLANTTSGIKAPHFVMWVKSQLEEKYGEEDVLNHGYKVTTTIDMNLQEKAEETVTKFGPGMETNFGAKNSSMVGIDPKTGEVLMMVGSRNYFNTDNDGNFNIALAHRQPGSTFKPIVYAQAFLKGYQPETVVFDLLTQFETKCKDIPPTPSVEGVEDVNKDCYVPENYDNKYVGPVSLRDALAQSKNIPSIKTLYLAGIDDSIRLARSMGISTLTDASRYGLSLVLGGGEVTLLDMTSAYGIFANDGERNAPVSILKIEDLSGNVLEENTPTPERVLPEQIARKINDVLSDNNARIAAFGANSALYIPGRQVAAKTGTTQNYRDVWIIGYTPNLVVGAWTGNNDNTPMERKVAGMIIAPMWNEYMTKILPGVPDERFVRPEVPDNFSALKPIIRGIWRQGDDTTIHEILYYVDRRDPMGPVPAYPQNDPQFEMWEKPVQQWVAEHSTTISTLPGSVDSSATIAPRTPDVSTPTQSPTPIQLFTPGSSGRFQ